MLNWKDKVNQTSKRNVQSFVDVFDKFINQNHKTEFSYDQKVRKQWEAFKKVIEADPSDVQAHNKYVNMLKTNSFGTNADFNKATNRIMMRFENIGPILMQINRNKLEQVAKNTAKLIAKNTRALGKL